MRLGGNERLTPRERVLRALNHTEPDRVPIDYCANAGIDRRLKTHFGLAPDDGEGLLQALGVDFRGIHAPYTGPRLHPEVPGRHVDPLWGTRTRWVEHGAGGYWDFCDFPLKDADEQTVANWPMPSPDHFDYAAAAEQCRRHDAYALYAGGAGLGDILNQSGMIRSVEQVMIDLLTEDPAWLAWVDRKLAIDLEVTARTLEAARGRIDFLWIGEDLGSQDAPLIGLESFRRFIRPRHQKLVDLARSFGIPVMIHSCGSSSWAYDDFIEMGIAAVDTLQPEAANMAPAYLKERFGARLAFHGCISTGGPVAFGTVDDVVADCRRTLEVMMPGGGYCFSPTHALQDNSPTENVLAMYETAHEYGRY
jgi:uroporphyrinogen decarboxylase